MPKLQSAALAVPDAFSTAIDHRLLHYLTQRLEVPSLHYLHRPRRIPDGWETSVYHFHLAADEPLPLEYSGPLTLRQFDGNRCLPAGRHSWAVQSFLRQAGYPVPAPICWEEASTALGGPFLLMEQIPGPTLLQHMLSAPWSIVAAMRQLADLQVWLHELPTEGFPCPPGPFLERSLGEIAELIDRYHLASLKPPYQWLERQRPPAPAVPRIVHLDFHPGNLISRKNDCPIVLDWDTADLADPHAEIGKTLMLMRCTSNLGQNLRERVLDVIGRDLLKFLYLFFCHQRMAIDRDELTYYQAWAALLRLACCCRCLIASPRVAGLKPSWTRHLHRDHLQALCTLFQRLSGVPVSLEEDSWRVQPT